MKDPIEIYIATTNEYKDREAHDSNHTMATKSPPLHDATNLAKYPWVQTCLDTYMMVWLYPVLSLTSASFRNAMKTEQLCHRWRVIKRAKTCATSFLLALQRFNFKTRFILHMWAVWPHVSRDNMNNVLREMLALFEKKPMSQATHHCIQALGLCQNRGTVLLKLLIRIACLMIHFGMKDTTLYEVFMTRIDLYLYDIRQDNNIFKPISFKRAIQYLEANTYSFSLWVWNLHQTPVYVSDDPVWELFQLWSMGSRSHIKFVKRLPWYYQQCLIFFQCYINLHGSNGSSITGKCHRGLEIVKEFMDK